MHQLDRLGRTFCLPFCVSLDTAKPVEALAILVRHGLELLFFILLVQRLRGRTQEVEYDAQRLMRDGVVLKMNGAQQQIVRRLIDMKHLLDVVFKELGQWLFIPLGEDTLPAIELGLNARLELRFSLYFLLRLFLPMPSLAAPFERPLFLALAPAGGGAGGAAAARAAARIRSLSSQIE